MIRPLAAIAAAWRRFASWQGAIPDEGRVTLAGLILVAAACLAAGLPVLAAGIPGGIFIAVGLGANLRDPRASLVLIGAIAAVLVAIILGGR